MSRGGDEGLQRIVDVMQSMMLGPSSEKLKLNEKKLQVYIKYPKSMQSHLLQLIYSQNSPYAQMARRPMTKLMEYGFVLRERKRCDEQNIASVLVDQTLIFGEKIDRGLRQACMQSIPVDEERDADQLSMVPLVAIRTCFTIFLICIYISSVFYIRERLMSKSPRKGNKVLRNRAWRIGPTPTLNVKHFG